MSVINLDNYIELMAENGEKRSIEFGICELGLCEFGLCDLGLCELGMRKIRVSV